jgi:hypothetical protein
MKVEGRGIEPSRPSLSVIRRFPDFNLLTFNF